jgi:hypothetical protein
MSLRSKVIARNDYRRFFLIPTPMHQAWARGANWSRARWRNRRLKAQEETHGGQAPPARPKPSTLGMRVSIFLSISRLA